MRTNRTACTSFLALVALLALTGCSAIRVKLGSRVSLARTPISSMEAALSGDPGLAPGQKGGLDATLTDPTGKVFHTEGKGHGKILWKDLTVTPTVVTADKKGNVTMPRDPRLSDGKTGHVVITAPSQPALHAELDIPVSYKFAFVSNYSGASGSSGFNGTDGQSGSSGSDGSTDPDHPSAGGNGGNGTDGSNGSDGSSGGDGPPVTVYITLRPGPVPLLQVGVTAPGHKQERFYLVDPNGGSLTVNTTGGSGGGGGKGGKGGAGGSGGAGSPPGSSGSSGSNGQDGRDGSDGRGGTSTVF